MGLVKRTTDLMGFMSKTFAVMVLLVLLSSCGGKNDPMVTLSHDLDHFTWLSLESAFEVELVQDSFHRLEVESSSKFAEALDFKIVGATLHVKNGKGFRWTSPESNSIKLRITSPDIDFVIVEETCNITTDAAGLSGDYFGIVVSSKLNQFDIKVNHQLVYYWNNFPCSGVCRFSGAADRIQIENGALMEMQAKDLTASYVYVENSSQGFCSVRATDTLEYKITGEGEIYSYGSPTTIIAADNSGSGSFIQVP